MTDEICYIFDINDDGVPLHLFEGVDFNFTGRIQYRTSGVLMASKIVLYLEVEIYKKRNSISLSSKPPFINKTTTTEKETRFESEYSFHFTDKHTMELSTKEGITYTCTSAIKDKK